jgi:hypothetical protein
VNELIEPKNEEESNVQPPEERAVLHVLNARFILEAAEKAEIELDPTQAKWPKSTRVHMELSNRWDIINDRWIEKFNNENIPEVMDAFDLKYFVNWATKSYATIGKMNATVITDVLTN